MRRILRYTLSRRFRTLQRDERGVELIEFALISILFFMLSFGIMEFGRAIWIYGTVAHVAKEGARFAIVRGSESPRTATVSDVASYVNTRAAGMTGLNRHDHLGRSNQGPGHGCPGAGRPAIQPRAALGQPGTDHPLEHLPDGDRLLAGAGRMKQLLTRLYRTDDGLDLAEYAILAALIALVCVAMIINLGNSMNGALNNADTQLRSDGGV